MTDTLFDFMADNGAFDNDLLAEEEARDCPKCGESTFSGEDYDCTNPQCLVYAYATEEEMD